MKTIGLIGGLTWYSSLDYYRLLNELANKKLGGSHSAKLLLHSVDFGEIAVLTKNQDWTALADIMCSAAQGLQLAGADCIMIGANTMHHIAGKVQASIKVPLIHIADAVAAEIKKKGFNRVALLGTKYTMQLDFYKTKLAAAGIGVIIPPADAIEFINDAIYNEFGKGIFLPERKNEFLQLIQGLINAGAQGVILGCTEIPILIKQEDCPVPLFDTAFIHAAAATAFAHG